MFPVWGETVGASPGSSQNHGFKWFAHPFGGAESTGHAQDPAFLGHAVFVPSSLEVEVGGGEWVKGWRLFFFYLAAHNLPNCTSMQLFSVFYSFFVILCCSSCLFRDKHCSKGSLQDLDYRIQNFFFTNEKLKPCVR